MGWARAAATALEEPRRPDHILDARAPGGCVLCDEPQRRGDYVAAPREASGYYTLAAPMDDDGSGAGSRASVVSPIGFDRCRVVFEVPKTLRLFVPQECVVEMASSMAFVDAPRQQTVNYAEWGQWKARQASQAAEYAKSLPEARPKTATSQATMPVLVGREDEERARTATLDARRQHRASPQPGSQQAQRPLWVVCQTTHHFVAARIS